MYNTSISTGDPILNGVSCDFPRYSDTLRLLNMGLGFFLQTGFVALTSHAPSVTPFNLTAVLDYMVAGPSIMRSSLPSLFPFLFAAPAYTQIFHRVLLRTDMKLQNAAFLHVGPPLIMGLVPYTVHIAFTAPNTKKCNMFPIMD